jgi:hypothetical protein
MMFMCCGGRRAADSPRRDILTAEQSFAETPARFNRQLLPTPAGREPTEAATDDAQLTSTPTCHEPPAVVNNNNNNNNITAHATSQSASCSGPAC